MHVQGQKLLPKIDLNLTIGMSKDYPGPTPSFPLFDILADLGIDVLDLVLGQDVLGYFEQFLLFLVYVVIHEFSHATSGV